MRRNYSLIIAAVLAVVLALSGIIAARPKPVKEIPAAVNNSLKVKNGRQMYTDVTGDNLQPAAPPANSATSSDLSPQQAQPNYCADGEIPYVDGCVAR